jgi:hypothetical protein
MRKKSFVLAAMALVAIFVVSVPGQVEASGLKKAEKLATRAQGTVSAIRATNLQVKKTLESYNYIIGGKADDPVKEFKKLSKDLDKCVSSRKSVQYAAGEMLKAYDKYFVEWEESLLEYNSEEMRQKSEDRMNEMKRNYAKISEAGSQASAEFDAMIASLDDQVRFLGQDLNPSAIADLTEEAASLNEQATAFFSSIDETIKVATQYANSLKP